jgi:hypothetical protein
MLVTPTVSGHAANEVLTLGSVASRLALATLVAGCAQAAPVTRSATSTITQQSDGLRTFSIHRESDGRPTDACPFFGLVAPLSGILRVDRQARTEPVWLDVDGRHASIVWPEGFTLRFEPDGLVYDDHGTAIGRDGSSLRFDQVSPTDHDGTSADPYIASGLLFGRCYPFTP